MHVPDGSITGATTTGYQMIVTHDLPYALELCPVRSPPLICVIRIEHLGLPVSWMPHIARTTNAR